MQNGSGVDQPTLFLFELVFQLGTRMDHVHPGLLPGPIDLQVIHD